MQKYWQLFKENFWPISAILFCPCHLPLSMGAIASLMAGTVLGGYFMSYYNAIESILAVAFSFYFVLAFMIWVVRGPKKRESVTCPVNLAEANEQVGGLSTKQIVTWGIVGMFTMPALVSISFFTRHDMVLIKSIQLAGANIEYNSGFIWLVSIATVVMIPVMVIWLVWLWLAWVKTDTSQLDSELWGYDYEN